MLMHMAQSREQSGAGLPALRRRRQVGWRVLAGVAVAIQVMLLMGFSFLGLGWTGLWWYLTLVQAQSGSWGRASPS
jgi:hypothetical protein